LDDYRKFQLEKSKPEKKARVEPEKRKGYDRKQAADARKRVAPLKKTTEKYERDVLSNRRRLKEIDIKLSDPNLFTTSPDKAVTLGQTRAAVEKLIETLEDKWLTALERYETALEIEGLDKP